MAVRRNHTLTKEFTLPEIDAGTNRVIHLTQPAIDVLKNQAEITRNGRAEHDYAIGSVNQIWEGAMRHDGIRYRKAYQSRHTYACWTLTAGANPRLYSQAPDGISRIGFLDDRKQPGPGEHAEPEISRLCPISAPRNGF